MAQLEKSFVGIEKNLRGEQQLFIDSFSEFLKKSPKFKGVKTTDNKNISEFEKKLSANTIPAKKERDVYGTKEIRDDLEKLILIAIDVDLLRVDYAEITQAVLEVDKDIEDVSDELGDFLVAVKIEYSNILKKFKDSVLIKEQLSLSDQHRQSAIVCLGKAIEHARLAHIQFDNLYLETQKMVNDTSLRLKKLQDDMPEIEQKIKESEEQITNFSKKQSSIYTDFIAILGVFSAFVLVVFSSFFGLVKILENLNTTGLSILQTLIMSAIVMSFLITILYSLMYWVSLIIEKPIFKNCTKCKGKCLSPMHVYERHGFYLLIMFSCAFVIFVSILLLKFRQCVAF